jgi:hypothetical protein
MAAAIAVLDPEMAPKMTEARMVAKPNPPGTQPTRASAKRNSFSIRPVRSMRNPA